MTFIDLSCTGCGIKKNMQRATKTWWSLNNYHGISGFFCPKCFESVSHDANGPKHPIKYKKMLERF